MDSKRYDMLINQLAMKYRKPSVVIKKIVESQFEFIYNQAKQIDLSDVNTREELSALKTNFNVKYLFSLVVSYKSLRKIKEQNEINSKGIQ